MGNTIYSTLHYGNNCKIECTHEMMHGDQNVVHQTGEVDTLLLDGRLDYHTHALDEGKIFRHGQKDNTHTHRQIDRHTHTHTHTCNHAEICVGQSCVHTRTNKKL